MRTYCHTRAANRVSRPSRSLTPDCVPWKAAPICLEKPPFREDASNAVIIQEKRRQVYNQSIEHPCGRFTPFITPSISSRNVVQAHQDRHSHGNID